LPPWKTRNRPTKSPPSSPSEPVRAIRFFEKALVHAKGRWAGQPFLLEPWQKDLLRELYGRLGPDGRRWYREALIGIARKNGKSALTAGLALYHLTIGGEQGGEVYSLAGSRDQARIVFNVARAMVEASPLLAAECRPYRSVIEHKESGSIYRTLSADAGLAHGYNPVAAIVDELHVHPNGDLYEAMKTAMGAREEPLLVSITTAGWDRDSFCYEHFEKARAGEDPRLLFRWWQAPQDAAPDDRAGWAAANPASWITEEFLEGQLASGLSQNTFARLHLNRWTESVEAWFPFGLWETRAVDRRLQVGEEVALALDGSFSGDSTALVAATRDGFVSVVGAWEKPTGDDGWRVNIADVEAAVVEACRTYRVVEVTADPYRWARSLEVLAAEGLPVTEFPQSVQRMSPATSGFHDAVMNGSLSHDGDGRLARHVANCVLKTDARGSRIVKDSKTSVRKIDLAVSAVMAFERARSSEGPSVYEGDRGLLVL
jgi:phage terminase large subunit-like protein